MLIRIVIDNLYSFKSQTEFNLLPSRVQHLPHHKINQNGISFLRMSALYGANGAGKTNMIKTMDLLSQLVKRGKITSDLTQIKFRLNEECKRKPSSIAVEFISGNTTFYYTISFDGKEVVYEYLAESTKESDSLIFEREYSEGKEHIQMYEGYANNEKNKVFIEVLEEKLIGRNNLLLSFLSEKYEKDFPLIHLACDWFVNKLKIISSRERERPIVHMLDKDSRLFKFANDMVSSFDTGISSMIVTKNEVKDEEEQLYNMFQGSSSDVENITEVENKMTGERITFVRENEKIMAKRLMAAHKNDENVDVAFNIGLESDGTQRLLHYLPFIYDVIENDYVYLIDEIERSIHPINIKNIISSLSEREDLKGQLVFTTHESSLLDQNILRTDEIWFAQKDKMGATQLYSLSDYNVHHTANIENGYLNGRYGGIPFTSNLNDIHWKENEQVFSKT